MFNSGSRYQCRLNNLFFILIIFTSIASCVSPPYSEQNSHSFRPVTHKVSAGETLFSIAWRYGVKYQDLAKYNHISSPYRIYPNQIIRLDIRPVSKNIANNHPVVIHSKSGVKKAPYSKINRSKNQTYKESVVAEKSLHYGAPSWSWPSKGSILRRFDGATTLNKGIDIGGKLGEPVLAAANGEVVYAGSGLRGYGKLLILRHNELFLSAYAHNNRLLVKEGDFVKAGQKIADMGSSGTNGVKLHFEIRRDGSPEDPMKYLPRR